MTGQTLTVAIVGHTNVGKTSLLRTLTRDSAFGDVAARPGTTRSVEAASIPVGEGAIVLFDTPGLEDSPAVRAHLQAEVDSGQDWVEAIAHLSDGAAGTDQFAQEAKALRQVIGSDAMLYVIDVRDPVRAKHRDELEILMRCGRPILAALNFVAQSRDGEESWRDTLARTNIHAIAPFDTVAYSEGDEVALHEKMRTLLDSFAPLIDRRLADVRQARRAQLDAALGTVADLAVSLAALKESVAVDDADEKLIKSDALKQAVREKEEAVVGRILQVFRFDPDIYDGAHLPLEAEIWKIDPFDPNVLADFGLNTGAAAATGAAIGVGFDLLVGGVTLGAAALTGAVLGGGFDATRRYGRAIRDRLTGRATLKISAETLALILSRALALIAALRSRGHGADAKLTAVDAQQLVEEVLPIAKVALKTGSDGLAEALTTRLKKVLEPTKN
ncbi:MAG: GTPase/DUF3482 domain-containing protein [Sphingomonadales bacterium]